MIILVCLKSIPREVIRPRVSESGDRVLYECLGRTMNESDEYALEQALSLKVALGADLVVASVGTLTSQEVLYVGLAKGADQGMRIDADVSDPEIIATLVARAARKLGVDLILTGVESWDNLASQVGMLAAAALNIPSVHAVTRIERGDEPGSLTVTRELGGGIQQVLAVPLPALLAVQSSGQTLSYAPPTKVIRARRSPLKVLGPADLGLARDKRSGPRWLKIVEVRVPERKQQAELIEGNSKRIAASILERIRNAAG